MKLPEVGVGAVFWERIPKAVGLLHEYFFLDREVLRIHRRGIALRGPGSSRGNRGIWLTRAMGL
ncbi:MAG: hypothetical protein NPIRA03_31900 [Nitrospirales bacterium]|nr:MAG: hypothetical protein NPIRA03_31900 [Nitrospirales bacterium]